MIHVGDETLISMSEASNLLKKRLKLPKAPHASTLWRWREKGLLDSMKVAGKCYTSVEAVGRFLANCCKGKKTRARLSPTSKKDIKTARRKCAAAGI